MINPSCAILSCSEHFSEVVTASVVLPNVREAGSFTFPQEDTEEKIQIDLYVTAYCGGGGGGLTERECVWEGGG